MNKVQTLIKNLDITAVNKKVQIIAKELKHDPYMSSRAYAAGLQCGMEAILSAVIDSGAVISINKVRKKRRIYVKSPINIRNVAHRRVRRNTK